MRGSAAESRRLETWAPVWPSTGDEVLIAPRADLRPCGLPPSGAAARPRYTAGHAGAAVPASGGPGPPQLPLAGIPPVRGDQAGAGQGPEGGHAPDEPEANGEGGAAAAESGP